MTRKAKALPVLGLSIAVAGAAVAVAPTYADYYDDVEPTYVSCDQIADRLGQFKKLYLTEDGCGTNLVVPTGANSALDLRSHDFSANGGIAVYVPADATFVLTGQNTSVYGTTGQNTIVNYGNLTVDSLTVHGNIVNYGTLIFKNSTLSGSMVINYLGTVNSDGSSNNFGTTVFAEEGGDIRLINGTFASEPAANLIADGYEAYYREDSTDWSIRVAENTPVDPVQPADPEDPSEPSQPDTPSEPENPDTPSTPETPAGDKDNENENKDEQKTDENKTDEEEFGDIAVKGLSAYMAVGSAEHITVAPEAALNTISSRDESILAVSGNQVTALHPGTTSVVVSTKKGDYTYNVRVYDLYSTTVSGSNYDALRTALNATLSYYSGHPEVSSSISAQVTSLMNAIENGSLLSINLGINDAETVGEEVTNGIRGLLEEGYNLTPFYDVFVSASDDAGTVTDVRLSELTSPVNIALPLPQSLIDTKDDRSFYVIYAHTDADGKTVFQTIKDVTVRANLQAIAFSANQFSIYAIAYSGDVVNDTEFNDLIDDSYVDPLAVGETVAPAQPETPAPEQTASAPDTGRMTNEDGASTPVRILLTVGVIAVLAVLGRYGYQRFITRKGVDFESYDE